VLDWWPRPFMARPITGHAEAVVGGIRKSD
jgi:hypothetical protein